MVMLPWSAVVRLENMAAKRPLERRKRDRVFVRCSELHMLLAILAIRSCDGVQKACIVQHASSVSRNP